MLVVRPIVDQNVLSRRTDFAPTSHTIGGEWGGPRTATMILGEHIDPDEPEAKLLASTQSFEERKGTAVRRAVARGAAPSPARRAK